MSKSDLSILGVVGSSLIIGDDPWSAECWSGSARSLFTELKKQGVLEGAVGFDIPIWQKYTLALKNIAPSLADLKKKFALDPAYYAALTKHAGSGLQIPSNTNVILQLGAIYNMKKIAPSHCKVVSYHDGNVAKFMQSPNFDKRFTPYALKAMEWERRVYDDLDHIFTMSEYLRQSMIKDFKQPPEKVTNVGVGVNFDVPEASEIPEQKNPYDIVFVGREFFRKGGACIIKAFRDVQLEEPEAKLHIIGPSAEELGSDILKMKNVVHYGFLRRDDANDVAIFKKVMLNSAIGVFPTQFDAFGIPVLEKMAYEIPCITSNILAMPEIIDHGKTGFLIDVDDSAALSETILYYMKNKGVREAHGKLARDLVINNYTWHTVSGKIIDFTTKHC